MQLGLPMPKAAEKSLQPDQKLVERFRRSLDPLIQPQTPIGVGVSGGPDSMALLLLAAAARPGLVEAATVDHGLRPEARKEAEMVAEVCQRLGVPHNILTVEWQEKPETGIQERARIQRFRLLGNWIKERRLRGLLTAHHTDDQAETFVMRLVRGAGVKGLAGMRRAVKVPGTDIALVRPLLNWRRSELEELCEAAGLKPVDDPSNADEQFERTRIRKALANAEWLDAKSVALSADNLAQADVALQWAASHEWNRAVTNGGGQVVYRPTDAPREIRRRIIRRAVMGLATEGRGSELRGPEVDRLLAVLASGRKATLRGVLCVGGAEWRFQRAPARRTN
jgi:tRNA(Ile)-lysidine synthase